MDIHLVYEDDYVVGAFSQKDVAERYGQDAAQLEGAGKYSVRTMTIDGLANYELKTCYAVNMMSCGHILGQCSYKTLNRIRDDKTSLIYGGGFIVAESYVSMDDALKMANEKRIEVNG